MTNIERYLYSTCHDPKRIKVFDAYSQSFVEKELPCGECVHCKMTRVNEWVTRMYCQAKYSQNVYFLSLDYAPFDMHNKVAAKLASETNAVYHNINKFRHYGFQPLTLCKSHLQNFHKRLRKLGYKYQYFACGEYGHEYGRPHFHLIIFTNDTIPYESFDKAWTIDGYSIGRVDCHDLVSNGSFIENDKINSKYNSKYCFKYVCKYLQKGSFESEKLPTISFHKEKMFQAFKCGNLGAVSLDSVEALAKEDRAEMEGSYWSEYSPFCVSSKRPALGYQYFQDNIERFEARDFRLFGISKQATVFPSYFIRKTKESLCSFACIGKDEFKHSSSARLKSLVSALVAIQNDFDAAASRSEDLSKVWRLTRDGKYIVHYNKFVCLRTQLDLYDRSDHSYYMFVGYGYEQYRKIRGLGVVKTNCFVPLSDMIYSVFPEYNNYWKNWVLPMYDLSVLSKERKENFICQEYNGDERAYRSALEDLGNNLKSVSRLQQLEYLSQKTKF